MILKHAVPILYSSDVVKSLEYYTKVLGFTGRWIWHEAPAFGGVSKNGVEIFFCENGQGNPGTWLSVFLDDVDAFFESVKAKGAKIISTPESMPWGVREMLIEDPDGHKIRFGQNTSERHKNENRVLAANVTIIERRPDAEEYRRLIAAVGWTRFVNDAVVEKFIKSSVYAVVAEDAGTGEIVGCAFLLGDDASFYYVKDVMVNPLYQGQGIGSLLMKQLTQWLETNAPDNALVALLTGENLKPFYQQFEFSPSFAMQRRIRRNEE